MGKGTQHGLQDRNKQEGEGLRNVGAEPWKDSEQDRCREGRRLGAGCELGLRARPASQSVVKGNMAERGGRPEPPGGRGRGEGRTSGLRFAWDFSFNDGERTT